MPFPLQLMEAYTGAHRNTSNLSQLQFPDAVIRRRAVLLKGNERAIKGMNIGALRQANFFATAMSPRAGEKAGQGPTPFPPRCSRKRQHQNMDSGFENWQAK